MLNLFQRNRSVRFVGLAGLALFALLSFACGGGSTSTKVDPNQPSFRESTDKKTFMGTKVFGPMGAKFKEFDATRFASFGCQTCHRDGNNADYKMPSGIFPMDPNNMPTVDDPGLGKTVKFMTETVLPTMKTILNDSTLTCFSCHGTKK